MSSDFSILSDNDDLPIGWEWTTLKEIAKIKGGKRLPKGSDYSDIQTPYPYIRVTDFKDGSVDLNNIRYISEEIQRTISNYTVNENDLYISIAGSIGIVGLIPKELHGANLTENAAKILLNQNINPKYLYQILSSKELRIQIYDETISTTQPKLALFRIETLKIPLPPLNEQRRIVEKVEALMARSHRAKEALDAIPKLIEQFRQSVLAAAFRGDLTADWRKQNPNIEPASVLLERIRKERREKWEQTELEKMRAKGKEPLSEEWKKKYKEPEVVDDSDLPELPDGWYWLSFEEIISDLPRSLQSGPFGSNLLHSEFQKSGVLAIGIDNVQDGYFSIGSEHRINMEKYQELEKYTARPNDVLITIMATVGRCCVLPDDIEASIITKHVYRISPEFRLINPYFLMNSLRGSNEVLLQLYGAIRGQTRAGINGQILKSLIIPIAPLNEQNEVVLKINNYLNSIKELQTKFTELSIDLINLNQSILSKAFRGELVEQDPNDEPASVLLERIQKEREKEKTKVKQTGAKKLKK